MAIYADDDALLPDVYNVYETFSIKLATSYSDYEPVDVKWHVKDFDGQQSHIQMDLDDLSERDIDTEVYDDLSISFKDAAGSLSFSDGKQIQFGEEIHWKLSPLVKKEEISSINFVANLWLAMIWVAVSISLFFAIY